MADGDPCLQARRLVSWLLATPNMHLATFRWALVVVGSLSVFARPAAAQTTPTVTANPLPITQTAILTLEQRELVDNGREGRQYVLTWSIGNGSGFRYRISLDRDDIRSSPQDLVPVSGTTEPEGSATSALNSIQVDEDDLLNVLTSSASLYGQEGDLTIHLLVFQVDDTPGEDSTVFRDAWTFQYDFGAPDAPPLELATSGERSIQIEWGQPAASDLQFYQVDFCPNVPLETVRMLTTATVDPGLVTNTSTSAYELMMMPCDGDDLKSRSSIQETETSITISDDIEEGNWVAFALFAQDESPFLNLTTETPVYAVRTEAATDFWERQRELGGGEDGGFCFVATAAHGSYAHPVVGLLRGLRDEVLARLPFGRALTRAYYGLSPPLAEAIDADPTLAAATRGVLLLVVFVILLVPLFLGGVLVTWLASAWRRRGGAAVLVLIGLSALPRAASAQELRAEATGPLGVAFEFKAGPYLPAIAEETVDGGLLAWDQIYGGGRSRVLVNLGGELQFLRGDFGTVSVGGTAGFIAWEGRTIIIDEDGNEQRGINGSTTFNIVPMTLTLGYRFDLLMDRTPVPLAPYVRAGLAYHLFWNTRDDGSLSRFTVDGEEREALGGRLGFVGTLGLSFALNAIDPNGATRFHATTGIRTSYLFVEAQLSQVDGFGDESNFDFSELTWFGGLRLEL